VRGADAAWRLGWNRQPVDGGRGNRLPQATSWLYVPL